MSQFSYSQYQEVATKSNSEKAKIGYFKLKDDGDIAIARINLSSTNEFSFAAVHTVNAGGRWIKVSCLNPIGTFNSNCALCAAYKNNPKSSTIGKSIQKMFIPMLVSYRDSASATGYTAPIPVIWDRPAGFSRELANKLMIAGNLRESLVLITRNGKAGDMQTTYSVDVLPSNHPVFKPEMIPADFSAFNNFNIAQHSYWEKTADEINTFISTGSFPERSQSRAIQTVGQTVSAVIPPYIPTEQTASIPVVESSLPPWVSPPTATPTAEPTAVLESVVATPSEPLATTNPNISNTTVIQPTATPARNFTGFSF